jgi:methyl-accepting chemotaxis protein
MSILAKLGITQRLYTVVAAVGLALAAVAAFAYVQLHVIIGDAERIAEQRMPQMQRVANIELDVTRTSLQLRHAILSRTPEELATTLADVGKLRQRIATRLGEYESGSVGDEARKRYAPLPALVARFWEMGEANLALIQKGDKEGAFAFLVDKTIPARNALLSQLAEGTKFYEGALMADVKEIEADSKSTLSWLIGLVVAVTVGLALFSWSVASTLRRRVAVAQAGTERVKDGDFTQPVVDDARDEFSPLLAALGTMQTALSQVVSTVRGNAESVATASSEIAQGNQDLSQRTEEQASALEQTAASMEQLGSTVRQNADNANQADQLAKNASSVAIQGGEVVGAVVQTMKGIEDSSRRIADIIGVIDGIAFQTNILALNAAVEAARAGEQGRGFAVVASEVRSLAQRSAEAAKEIKSLITASVEQVGQGTALADKAGTTMQEVVSAIRRVTDIVGEISTASTEQSAGVSQVGEAVGQMDQVTQQNAALVEESAAAAESLKTQAQQLVQAVALFKLAEHGGRAAPPAYAAAPAAKAPAGERRAPDRAKNVVRPKFKAKEATPPAPASEPGSKTAAKTGSDDWTSF